MVASLDALLALWSREVIARDGMVSFANDDFSIRVGTSAGCEGSRACDTH